MENNTHNTAQTTGTSSGCESTMGGAAYPYYGTEQSPEILYDASSPLPLSAPVPGYTWSPPSLLPPPSSHHHHHQRSSSESSINVHSSFWDQPQLASSSSSSLSSTQTVVQPTLSPSSPPMLVPAYPLSSASSPSTTIGALNASTPQSTVSSEPSSSAHADVGAGPERVQRKKPRSIDRNRRPCGACSSSKRKCKLISLSPELCERCHKHGLSACPPHVSWARRCVSIGQDAQPGSYTPTSSSSRSSTGDGACLSRAGSGSSNGTSLSPGDMEWDTRSRSQSPLFAATYNAAGLSVYTGMDGAQQQPMSSESYFTPSPRMSSPELVGDAGLTAEFTSPLLKDGQACQQLQHEQQQQLDFQMPRCHVCSTPYAYDQVLLGYMLAQSGAPLPTPAPSPSEAAEPPVTPYLCVSEPPDALGQAYQSY